MSKRELAYFIILMIITVSLIWFIWSNSFVSAELSSVESEGIRAFINNLLKNMNINFTLTSHITRKLAHFFEFALLGFFVVWTSSRVNSKTIKNIFIGSSSCLLVSIIDECIQIFSPGRACQITDVIVDFSGAISGIIFFIILNRLIKLFSDNMRGRKVND